MSRKSARETAFKTIFEIPFHSLQSPNETIDYTVECAGNELSGDNDLNYFKSVTLICYENIDIIDSKISQLLKSGWSLDRISKVNLSILRLAISEILYMDDIPYQVSINEAVELAKTYGDDDAPSFINGILAFAVS